MVQEQETSMEEKMSTIVDVLPSDGTHGVVYDKNKTGSVYRGVMGEVQKVGEGEARVLVTLAPITSDSLRCCSDVAEIAEKEGKNLLLVFSHDYSLIGCMAH